MQTHYKRVYTDIQFTGPSLERSFLARAPLSCLLTADLWTQMGQLTISAPISESLVSSCSIFPGRRLLSQQFLQPIIPSLTNNTNREAAVVGWEQPYVYALLIVSILHFVLFVIWEGRFAKEPILPLDIWGAPSFGPMVLSAFMSFMGVGIFLYYVQIWNISIRHYSNLLTGAVNSAFATVGTCGCFVSAIAVRYLPAQVVMATGAIAAVVATIILATMPAQQTYWAQCFPSFIIMGFSPDFIFTATQIITSNSVPRKHQGIAGSLMGTIQMYGLSTGLGFAGTVERYTNDGGRDQLGGIRHALYLTIGMAGASALISLFLIRIPKDQRDGWDKEDEAAA